MLFCFLFCYLRKEYIEIVSMRVKWMMTCKKDCVANLITKLNFTPISNPPPWFINVIQWKKKISSISSCFWPYLYVWFSLCLYHSMIFGLCVCKCVHLSACLSISWRKLFWTSISTAKKQRRLCFPSHLWRTCAQNKIRSYKTAHVSCHFDP